MKKGYNVSELHFSDIEDYLDKFNPIKLYIDHILIWDDCLPLTTYINYEIAISEIKKENPIINNIKIDIVEFHHSVIYLETVKNS